MLSADGMIEPETAASPFRVRLPTETLPVIAAESAVIAPVAVIAAASILAAVIPPDRLMDCWLTNPAPLYTRTSFCARAPSVTSFRSPMNSTTPSPPPATAYEWNSTTSPSNSGSTSVIEVSSVAVYSLRFNLTPLTNTSRKFAL